MTLDTPLRIVTVCTGNICRSAFAHHYLSSRLDQLAPGRVVVDSAGTAINPDLSVPSHIVEISERHGVDVTGHSPKELTDHFLADADLVLTATTAHRTSVLRLRPVLLKRTFTILEFAHVLGRYQEAPVDGGLREQWKAALALGTRLRSSASLELPSEDIPDPYGKDASAYAQMEREIIPALDTITQFLAGISAPTEASDHASMG